MKVFKNDIIDDLSYFLFKNGSYKNKTVITKDEIENALKELNELNKITIAENKYGSLCVYLSYYYYIENEIVKLLKNILREPKEAICLKEDIDKFLMQKTLYTCPFEETISTMEEICNKAKNM